jgi:hypothetical protein
MSLWSWVRDHLTGETDEPPSTPFGTEEVHSFVGLIDADDPGYLETGAERRAERKAVPGGEQDPAG